MKRLGELFFLACVAMCGPFFQFFGPTMVTFRRAILTCNIMSCPKDLSSYKVAQVIAQRGKQLITADTIG